MTKSIDSSEDIIDSRDVIRRIDDLEGTLQAVYDDEKEVLDEEYIDAQTAIDEAFDDILADYPEASKEVWLGHVRGSITHPLGDAVKLVGDTESGVRPGPTFMAWLLNVKDDIGHLYQDEAIEYLALKSLADEAEGYDDWAHGVTLIRYSYWVEYVEQLANDIGAVSSTSSWPNNCIDWEQAARELEPDYSTIEFDGVEYWMRS